MNSVLCPQCGEIICEEPCCQSVGIITCDKCHKQIVWQCDGKVTKTKVYK